MADIQANSGSFLAAMRQSASQILARQLYTLTAINFPTVSMRVTQSALQASTRQNAKIRVTQAAIFVAAKGRSANPKIRSWTFTLDGHDFYVLNLGDDATLIYDTSTEQWVEWTHNLEDFWRVATGFSWIGGQGVAQKFGSNIICGDDTFGLLYTLDPELAWDQNPDAARSPQQIAFERIVTGQAVTSGRLNLPCYAVFVDGDNYGLSATDFVPGVVLETSDDQGRNFDVHDTLLMQSDITVDNPYAWYSLGQISSPGRIFRVRDTGIFTRIDSMDMNDDGR